MITSHLIEDKTIQPIIVGMVEFPYGLLIALEDALHQEFFLGSPVRLRRHSPPERE
jgi:hypothetical protein